MRSEGDQKNKKIPYSPYVTHTPPCHPPPRVPMDERILSFSPQKGRDEEDARSALLSRDEAEAHLKDQIQVVPEGESALQDNRSPHFFFSTLGGTLIQPQKQEQKKPKADSTLTLTPHPTLTPRPPPPHTPHPYPLRCTRRPPRRGRRRRRSWGG